MTEALDVLEGPALKGLKGIHSGFFGRKGGVSKGLFEGLNCGGFRADSPEAVLENRRKVAAFFDLAPEALLTCAQVHSTKVEVVSAGRRWDPQRAPEADAMVTQERGVALGILTADCVPVLFADPEAGVIGAAHAGWRGAIGGVCEATLKAMEALGAQKKHIHVAIGPCIWQDSYEVGESFPAPFLAEDPANEAFFRAGKRAGHFQFDLAGYVRRKLEKNSLATVSPSVGDTCAQTDRFFSYRASCLAGEADTGRLISVIARV